MKKILLIILSVFIVAMMLSTSVVFAKGNELIVEFKDAGINVPNSGGSPYIEEDGVGYRSFVHEVNTGKRPVNGIYTGVFDTKGDTFTLVYMVKILSDDKSTADDTVVFGIMKVIKHADGKAITNEDQYTTMVTAKEIRAQEADEDGWMLFYNVITPDQYTIDGVEVDKINIDCEVYYNGAKGSGCAIDIGVRAISLYRGDLTAEEDEESENTTKDPYKSLLFSTADDYEPNLKMDDNAGANVGATKDGSWLAFKNMDFGNNGADSIRINYASNSDSWEGGYKCDPNAKLEIRLGSVEGELVGTIQLEHTGNGWGNYKDLVSKLQKTITGVQDIYFVMLADTETNQYVANLANFNFIEAENDDGNDDETPEENQETGDAGMIPITISIAASLIGLYGLKKRNK